MSVYYNGLTIQQHITCLKIALQAIGAVKNDLTMSQSKKEIYLQRVYGLQVSSYASIIYNYNQYYSSGILYRTDYLGANSIFSSLSSAKSNFYQMFLTACENAGVTKACEADLSIQEWLNNYVANGWV